MDFLIQQNKQVFQNLYKKVDLIDIDGQLAQTETQKAKQKNIITAPEALFLENLFIQQQTPDNHKFDEDTTKISILEYMHYINNLRQQLGLAEVFSAEELKNGNKKNILNELKQEQRAIAFADPMLKRDPEIVFEAIKRMGLALTEADPVLQSNKSFITKALGLHASAIFGVNPQLLQNKQYIQSLADTNWNICQKSFAFGGRFGEPLVLNNPHFELINSSLAKDYLDKITNTRLTLKKEYNIEFPSRFQNLFIAQEIMANRQNKSPKNDSSPIALLLYPKKDESSFFEVNQISELIKKGYKVMYYEINTDQELLDTVQKTGRNQKINLLVVAGHGEKNSIAFGAGDPRVNKVRQEEALYLDLFDVKKTKNYNFNQCLAPESIVIIESCSTGEGRDKQLNMANFLKNVFPLTEIFSPEEPTAIDSYQYGTSGKVTGVNYTIGAEKTYSPPTQLNIEQKYFESGDEKDLIEKIQQHIERNIILKNKTIEIIPSLKLPTLSMPSNKK